MSKVEIIHRIVRRIHRNALVMQFAYSLCTNDYVLFFYIFIIDIY